MRFLKYDVVRISKKSAVYGFNEDNPRDTDGVIVHIDPTDDYEENIAVKWIGNEYENDDEGDWDWYEERDLKLMKRPKE